MARKRRKGAKRRCRVCAVRTVVGKNINDVLYDDNLDTLALQLATCSSIKNFYIKRV